MTSYSEIVNQVWPEWQLEKLIGRGAYGSVYRASRRSGGAVEPAAVKIIPVPQDPAEADAFSSEGMSPEEIEAYYEKVMQGFSGEIQMMVALRGAPHIVAVEDHRVVKHAGEFRWDILIRMELLTPFVSYARQNPLGEQEVIRLGIQLCTALDICHRQNIIHRDIKPQNIFVDRFGSFKLGDFGIARKMEGLTGGLSQKGTYGYIAPEVSHSLRYDMRADIYSLGLVIYQQMNAGRLPFVETPEQAKNPRTRTEALQRRLSGEPLPEPSEASPAFAGIIMKACHYDPEKRYRSAAEMKADLQMLLISPASLPFGPESGPETRDADGTPENPPAPVRGDEESAGRELSPQNAGLDAGLNAGQNAGQFAGQIGVQPEIGADPADSDKTVSVRKPAHREPREYGNAMPAGGNQEVLMNYPGQNQESYRNQGEVQIQTGYPPQYPAQNAVYGPQYGPAGYGMPDDNTVRGTPYEPVSLGMWFGYLLLMCLPGVGLILNIVFACGAGTNKRSLINFSRAVLLFILIGMILSLIAAAVILLFARSLW